MNTFATLAANLNINISNFVSGLRTASRMSGTFIQQMQTQMQGFLANPRSQANRWASTMRGMINSGWTDPTKKAKFEFKDVARIVQGIIISKIFYGGLNSIRQATHAVWEFSNQLEYAKIAYSNLFGSTALAEEFINVLKDFAARTPFSFSESEAAAKRLLAYGVEYKNVMYMLQGIMSASAVTGNPETIERVSRALGQVYTKGRLMNEEMRQLAEAGIPAYEILREKLGLTQKQLQNLGKEAIPASTAINALIEGMTERYGNVVEAASRTMIGIVNKVKDNLLLLLTDAFEPLYNGIKVVMNGLGDWLFMLREISKVKGIGGVFEAMFPPSMHGILRTFAANIKGLFNTLKIFVKTLIPLWNEMWKGLIIAANMVVPVISALTSVLGGIIGVVTSNAGAMRMLTGVLIATGVAWMFFRIQAMAAMAISAIVGVIAGIVKALGFLAAALLSNPILTIFFLIAAAAVGINVASGGANETLSKLFNTLTQFNGFDPEDMFPVVDKETPGNLEDFDDALDDTNDSLDDTAKKAKKAAQSLLSFDEVFRLTEQTTEGGLDTGEDMNINIPSLSGLADAFMPELPQLDSAIGDFVSNIMDQFGDALLDKLEEMALGASIGALIGGILAGPIGAAVGGLAGMLAGLFWDEFMNYLGLADTQKMANLLAMVLGAVLGALLKGLKGGAIGALLGLIAETLVSWLIAKIAEFFGKTEEDLRNAGIGQMIGMALGAIIGGLLAGPMGAIIGAAIGSFVGGLVGLFWNELMAAFEKAPGAKVAMGIATAIGAIIGGILAGPGGALLGGAIGFFVSGLSTILWTRLAEHFGKSDQDIKNSGVGQAIGTAIGALFGWLLGGPVGAGIGAAIGNFAGGFVGLFWDTLGRILEESPRAEFAHNLSAIIAGLLGLALGGPIVGVLAWFGGQFMSFFWTALSEALGKGDEGAEKAIFGAGIGTAIGAVLGFVLGGPGGAAIGAGIGHLVGGIVGLFWEELTELFGSPGGAGAALGTAIGAALGFVFGGPVGAAIGAAIGLLIGAVSAEWDRVVAYFRDVAWKNFTDTVAGLWEWVVQAFTWDSDASLLEIGGQIVWGILAGISAAIGALLSGLFNLLVVPLIDGVKYLFGIHSPATTMIPIGEFLILGILEGIINTVATLITGIGTFAADVIAGFMSWIDPVVEGFGTFATNAYEKVTAFLTDVTANIATWVVDNSQGFVTWFTETKEGFALWASESFTTFTTWITDTGLALSTWFEDVKLGFTTWLTETGLGLSTWFVETKEGFALWASESLTSLLTWITETGASFSLWFEESKLAFTTWFTETAAGLVTWATETGLGFTTWFTETSLGITTWVTDSLLALTEWAAEATLGFTTWWTETTAGFTTWFTDTAEGLGTWATDTMTAITDWITGTNTDLTGWWTDTTTGFATWWTDTKAGFTLWVTEIKTGITQWTTETMTGFKTWWTESKTGFSTWVSETATKIKEWLTNTKTGISEFVTTTSTNITTWSTNMKGKITEFISSTKSGLSSWISDTVSSFSNWGSKIFETISGWVSKAISKIQELFNAQSKAESSGGSSSSRSSIRGSSAPLIGGPTVDIGSGIASSSFSRSSGGKLAGHAKGGIFNREHIANFAEGNKAEAIIPLQNDSAMQPFVDAVSDGIYASLAPMFAQFNNAVSGGGQQSSSMQPLYVGTLVADERGLKELQRKMQIIQVEENLRRGRD